MSVKPIADSETKVTKKIRFQYNVLLIPKETHFKWNLVQIQSRIESINILLYISISQIKIIIVIPKGKNSIID